MSIFAGPKMEERALVGFRLGQKNKIRVDFALEQNVPDRQYKL